MLRTPYLIFLGNETSPPIAKTALGVRDWAPENVLCQWRLSADTIDLGVPDMTPEEAYAAGARSLLIGVAPIGGVLPPEWVPLLVRAIASGLDIISGLHSRLDEFPEIAAAAAKHARKLINVRYPDRRYPIATGRKRPGKRLLTVGTDCALGKKYTALALARELRSRKHDADFRATGQTGIMIYGSGVPIDAVIADFIAGAAETLSPDAAPDHWDIIEGQGSLFHPAYAAVTLGLLHGSRPDAMLLCHDPARRHINGYPDYPMPTLAAAIPAYEGAARLINLEARVIGISLNTSAFDPAEAQALAARTESETGLPCIDPLRFGMERIADLLETF